MNSAEFFSKFSSKLSSSSTMSLELAVPGTMFIKQESDIINCDTNRIDSNNHLQDFKQPTEEIESFGSVISLGDQIQKCQKVVFENKKKPTEKLPSKPKNAGQFRSSICLQYQIDALNLEYQKNNKYITISQKKEIAQKLNLSEKQVKYWFQNKRRKETRDVKRKFTSKTKLPPITTFSSICHKHILENFYSFQWNEENSIGNESPSERSGSLPQSIIPSTSSQNAETLTDNFLLTYCPEKAVSSNNLHLNSSSSLPHSSSSDTASPSLQMVHEQNNNNLNSACYQNDFFLNMPNNNVTSLPWVMQQALANPYLQYFNQWIYPFYTYWAQNQQFNINQEIPDDFYGNSRCLNNVQLLNNYSQRFENQLQQFPLLDFINSYNLGNHFLNM